VRQREISQVLLANQAISNLGRESMGRRIIVLGLMLAIMFVLHVSASWGVLAVPNESFEDGALSISISPPSALIDLGGFVTFNSTVSGGTAPHSYQWYVCDGSPVSGATSSCWTFIPITNGIYDAYLEVTDSSSSMIQSETARITVVGAPGVPVGGYSFSIEGHTSAKPLIPYLTLIAVIAIGFIMIRYKTTKYAT
jgi:hypothetical protein